MGGLLKLHWRREEYALHESLKETRKLPFCWPETYLSMDIFHHCRLPHIANMHCYLESLPESCGVEEQNNFGFKH